MLRPFKYAGYPQLLAALAIDSGTAGAAAAGGSMQGDRSTHFLSEEVAPQLAAATELASLSCRASALNGEELARSGGVNMLGVLIVRCVGGETAGGERSVVLASGNSRAACSLSFPGSQDAPVPYCGPRSHGTRRGPHCSRGRDHHTRPACCGQHGGLCIGER